MINRAILAGRVGGKPEIRNFENGGSIATFNLATNRNYQDRNGEWQTVTSWHNIVLRGKQVDRVDKIDTGDLLYIEGSIEYRSYEKEGQTRYITEIRPNYFRNLTPKQTTQSESSQEEAIQVVAEQEPDDDLPF